MSIIEDLEKCLISWYKQYREKEKRYMLNYDMEIDYIYLLADDIGFGFDLLGVVKLSTITTNPIEIYDELKRTYETLTIEEFNVILGKIISEIKTLPRYKFLTESDSPNDELKKVLSSKIKCLD